jgi:hypothetical protein
LVISDQRHIPCDPKGPIAPPMSRQPSAARLEQVLAIDRIVLTEHLV